MFVSKQIYGFRYIVVDYKEYYVRQSGNKASDRKTIREAVLLYYNDCAARPYN